MTQKIIHLFLLQLLHQTSISNLRLELLRLLALGTMPILLAIPMHLLAFATAVAMVAATLAELPIRTIQGSATSGAFLAKSAKLLFHFNQHSKTRLFLLYAHVLDENALACHGKQELRNCKPPEVTGTYHGPIGCFGNMGEVIGPKDGRFE